MGIILIVSVFYGISVLIRSFSQRRQSKELARIKAAQAKVQQEIRSQKTTVLDTELRMVELEREQFRQKQEQQRQAEILRRHEEQIEKLRFQIEQATADITAEQTRLSQLFALLDIAEANQAAAEPGSKADEQAQRKIIALENQIHATEKRIEKAKFIKATAEKKLAA